MLEHEIGVRVHPDLINLSGVKIAPI